MTAVVYNILALIWMLFGATGTARSANGTPPGVLNAAFVCVGGVYNSELMAPYDVLQHSVYRDDQNYIRCFIVTPDGDPFETAEGIAVTPDYAFDNSPDVDILVIPSTETSMTEDLHNEAYIDWIERAASKADWVITVCDGAFPLAATGLLDYRSATTFPGDRDRLQEMFNKIDVHHDVRLVVDGKFITSAGGAMSYEPALYLVERLYGPEHAARTAAGLVWPWNLSSVPHLIVEE
jgi:transcriptional regulator GlxA family with amidase domain